MGRSIYKQGPELEKKVTQGSIINHCVAEKYCCDVWGVIVTPRCDIAHTGKVTHVHYLPIVPFDEWYKVDGIHYMWTKTLEKYRTKLLNACKAKGYPTSNLGEKQLRQLCDSILDPKEKDKFKSEIDNFYQTQKINPSDYVPSNEDKGKMVTNLRKGDIAAFFLIEDWREGNKYMVVLLRELKRLDYNFAIGMASGIEETTISDRWKNDIAYSLSKDFLYRTEAELVSPFVEQLMERFSYNFCRIGVDDMDESVEDVLREIIK